MLIKGVGKQYNRGVGMPAPVVIDTAYRCEETRNCRICGKYDEGLWKIGKRAYAHASCYQKRYGKLTCK